MNRTPLALPKDFRFCVTTASHQIEGNNTNSDWWAWEQIPGKIKNEHRSGRATEAWNYFDDDIQNMKWLGVDTYRMSIEWAKVEPKEGQFDQNVLNEYLSQVDRLLAAGIEPMITLYHFTFPLWVSNQGGWDWAGVTPAFARFTEQVAKTLGTRVKIWCTLNEPMTVIAAGYITEVFPPGRNNMASIALPMENMVRAHAAAYHTLHRLLDSETFKPEVGIAHHLRIFDPSRKNNFFDRYASRKFDEIFNWAIPEALKTGKMKFNMPFLVKANATIPEAINTQDFFGINYYSRDLIEMHPLQKEKLVRRVAEGSEVQDLGWEIYPEGLKRLIEAIAVRFPRMPIWVTENGTADSKDHGRSRYIESHLVAIGETIAKGIPVKGLAWNR